MASSVQISSRFAVILSGPPAAGKNTVARLVSRHYPKTLAEIDLDKVKGFVESDPRTDFYLDLATEISLSMMRIYLHANLSVLIHNAFCNFTFVRPFIAIGDEMQVPTLYFKLMAPLDELLKRNRTRSIRAEECEVRRIYAIDQDCTHPEGISIDTMRYDANEAAMLILRAISVHKAPA